MANNFRGTRGSAARLQWIPILAPSGETVEVLTEDKTQQIPVEPLEAFGWGHVVARQRRAS